MTKNDLWPDWFNYTVVIERPDGTTFEQPYFNFEDVADLVKDVFGEGYKVVAIY